MTGGMRWWVVLLLGASAAFDPAVGAAQDDMDTGLSWQPEWRAREPWDWVASGLLNIGTLAIHLAADSQDGWWLRRNRMDESILRGLSAREARGRRIAGIVSDVTRALVIAPVLIDPGLAARDSPTLAGRMAGVSVLAFSTTLFLMTGAKYTFRRERPNVRRCEPDSEDSFCLGERRYRSFFSGHSALAFTSASLTCTYHTRMPLYGSRAADIAACGTAMAFATVTALLRIVAEKHHFSDVFVGALVGFISGFLIPTSLYFGYQR